MNKNNLLIVNFKSVNIDKAVEKYGILFNLYIASYDINIVNKYKNNTYVKKSLFLEGKNTVFDVYDSVITITDNINREIKKYFSEDLLFSRHVEGGYTTQAIQDAVLFKRSFKEIINKFDINNIYCFYEREYYKQSKYIENYSKEYNLIYRVFNFNFLKSLFIFHKNKIYMHEFRSLMYFCKINLTSKENGNVSPNTIVFPLYSDKNKHLDLLRIISKKIRDIKGCNVLYLTQTVSGNKNNLLRTKENMIALEHYLTVIDYIKSWVLLISNLKIWRHNAKNILINNRKYGYLIEEEIRHSLYANIIIYSAYRYRYKKAINIFFDKHQEKIIAFQLWGGVSLFEGMYCGALINKYYKNIRTLHFSIGVDLKEFPYISIDNDNIDYLLVDSEYERDICLAQNFSKNQIILLESFRFYQYGGKFYPEKESQSKIKGRYALTVLIDIQVSMPGYINLNETISGINSIATMAVKFENFLFIVKPHPSIKDVKYLHKKLKNIDNVKVYHQDFPIIGLISLSDVVVTKYSTIGYQSILLDKLLISVIHGESKFKAYEEGAIYVDEYKDVFEILGNFSKYKAKMATNVKSFKKRISKSKDAIKIENFVKDILKK